ncbi:hypothetical protein N7490_001147 [Penicillium lividum]|nr:hypothetical protein N7490_001147 [Penicillium lividum]
MFLNTTTRDLEIHFNDSLSGRRLKMSRTDPLSSGLSTIPATDRSDYDPVLMSYFEHIICSSSTLVDNAHYNPYRYLILPMALESKGIYHAALSIAANTLGLSDPKYRLPALEHHNHALGHLRGLFTHETWEEKELDEILGLVLMLCWFDISDNSRPSWVTHLNGFQNLIRTRQERPGRSPHSQELASFFNRYFAFHLVLARTAFRVQHSPILPNSLLESSDNIDLYMGFSSSLLLLINQVAELACVPSDGKVQIDLATVSRLKKSLEEVEQVVPAEHIHPNTECASIAEANRLGGLLLLQEICSLRRTGLGNAHLTQIFQEKNNYVGQILRLILAKKANMMRTAVLPLWPLFLAGCCVREEEERFIVLQLFEELESIRRFGNIAPAMEVVEMVWRQRDLSVQDERKRQKGRVSVKGKDPLKGACFTWEHAMVMLGGWKLSLT